LAEAELDGVIVSGSSPASRMWRAGVGTVRRATPSTAARPDVLGARPAAPADQVQHALAREVAQELRHVLGGVVVAAELVGQAGVGVAGDRHAGDPRELGDVRPHVVGAERAVDADREQICVRHRVVERLDGLARQRAAGPVRDRDRRDHRHLAHAVLEQLGDRVERGLAVERVDVGLGDQEVDAALDQRARLLGVAVGELAERDRAGARIVDVGRQRGGLGGRADRAGDPARAAVFPLGAVGGAARDPGGGEVQLADDALEAEIGQRERGRRERVGLDDIGPGAQEVEVNLLDRVGPGQREDVDAALDRHRVVRELRAAPRGLVTQVQGLDHRAHRAIEHDDALGHGFAQTLDRRHRA
jgi:hypothetical protein